jgi:hypothetical protein
MLQTLQESEAVHFDGIETSDKSRFRYFPLCSKMFAQSQAEVIPKTQQAICAK